MEESLWKCHHPKEPQAERRPPREVEIGEACSIKYRLGFMHLDNISIPSVRGQSGRAGTFAYRSKDCSVFHVIWTTKMGRIGHYFCHACCWIARRDPCRNLDGDADFQGSANLRLRKHDTYYPAFVPFEERKTQVRNTIDMFELSIDVYLCFSL